MPFFSLRRHHTTGHVVSDAFFDGCILRPHRSQESALMRTTTRRHGRRNVNKIIGCLIMSLPVWSHHCLCALFWARWPKPSLSTSAKLPRPAISGNPWRSELEERCCQVRCHCRRGRGAADPWPLIWIAQALQSGTGSHRSSPNGASSLCPALTSILLGA